MHLVVTLMRQQRDVLRKKSFGHQKHTARAATFRIMRMSKLANGLRNVTQCAETRITPLTDCCFMQGEGWSYCSDLPEWALDFEAAEVLAPKIPGYKAPARDAEQSAAAVAET